MVDVFDTILEGKRKVAYVKDKWTFNHCETEYVTETTVERVVIMAQMKSNCSRKSAKFKCHGCCRSGHF